MDKQEAKTMQMTKLAEYRCLSYADLVAKIGDNDCVKVSGPTGVEYQIEVQFKWDGKQGGDVRVMAGIDDGGYWAFLPLCDGFIVTPDGRFVGG